MVPLIDLAGEGEEMRNRPRTLYERITVPVPDPEKWDRFLLEHIDATGPVTMDQILEWLGDQSPLDTAAQVATFQHLYLAGKVDYYDPDDGTLGYVATVPAVECSWCGRTDCPQRGRPQGCWYQNCPDLVDGVMPHQGYDFN